MLRYSLYNEDQIRQPDLPESYGSDNSTAADNQQERLSVSEKKCWFLAGLIEGEGSLCVSIKNHKPSRFGYLVHPEFFIYQHKIEEVCWSLHVMCLEQGESHPRLETRTYWSTR